MKPRLLNRNDGQGRVPLPLACLNTTPGSIDPTCQQSPLSWQWLMWLHIMRLPPTDHPGRFGEEGGGFWDQSRRVTLGFCSL